MPGLYIENEDWSSYVERMEFFDVGTENEKKKRILSSCCGVATYCLFKI